MNTCGNRKCVYKSIVNSTKETCLEKYGVDNILKIPEFREQIKATMLERYGCEYSMQSEVIKEKARNKCIEHFGVDNQNKCREVREKTETTNLERYGFKCSFSNKDVQQKFKDNFMEKYGVNNPFVLPQVKINCKNACIRNSQEKYGVDYPSQSAEYRDNIETKFKFRWKDYILPSGKKVRTQGYENRALDELIKIYNENDIFVMARDIENEIGRVWYENKNKHHRYFPDIYIKSENKIIEVKSIWTYKLHKEINELKKQACLDMNLNFEYMIF